MIDPKSLRIGNLVYLMNDKGGIHKIHVIDGLDIASAEALPSLFSPIELTEILLVTNGFRYANSGYLGEDITEVATLTLNTKPHLYSADGLPFNFNIVRWNKGDFTFSYDKLRSDCKYVHQLQNLLYLLTNTELSFNI